MSEKGWKIAVPSCLTFSGIFLGLLCITWAPEAPYAAAVALIFAGIADLLDGKVARLLGVESDFGVQIDSLADFVNSGVAPALLVYHWSMKGWVVGGVDLFLLVALFYVLAAGTRLARFNIDATISTSDAAEEQKAGSQVRLNMFSGVPTPVASLLLATVVMTHNELGLSWMREKVFVVPYVLVVALLMVSKIPFRSFKNFKTKVGPFVFGGSILGGLTLLALGGPGGTVLLSVLNWYVLSGLFFWCMSKVRSQ